MSPPLPSPSARELLCCCGLSGGSGETATWEPLEAAPPQFRNQSSISSVTRVTPEWTGREYGREISPAGGLGGRRLVAAAMAAHLARASAEVVFRLSPRLERIVRRLERIVRLLLCRRFRNRCRGGSLVNHHGDFGWLHFYSGHECTFAQKRFSVTPTRNHNHSKLGCISSGVWQGVGVSCFGHLVPHGGPEGLDQGLLGAPR